MSSVSVVCDSTADLGDDLRRRVDVVPLKVIVGEDVFEDGVTITPADFYARMLRSTSHPRTSQPTPAEFEAVFRARTDTGGAVVCTTISAALSGTFDSASQARAALSDRDIRVIDTRSVAVGHHSCVRAALAAAAGGGDAEAVEAAVRHVMEVQRLLFTVETLEYLRRGGRIGGARAFLGSVLDVKPILAIRDGAIEPVDRVRTYQRALDRITAAVGAAAEEWGGCDVFVGHGDRAAVAEALAERMRAACRGGTVHVLDVGPVIGSHAGPGAIGVGFLPCGIAP